MDPRSLPRMRSGVAGEIRYDQETQMLTTLVALLRMFAKDSVTIAGRYTRAKRRRCVKARTMRKSLMYCARTFFNQDDQTMQNRINEEIQLMNEEEDESDGEEGEEEEEEGEEEEEEEDEEGEEEGSEECIEEPSPIDLALVDHVDKIDETWNSWKPTDPLHAMLKRAIDATPVAT